MLICLRLPIPFPSPLLHARWIHTPVLIHTGKGGWEVGEPKVRGALIHKRGRKYRHDWLYLQSINSIKHQVKTTFRVWCLYRYLVHGEKQARNDFSIAYTFLSGAQLTSPKKVISRMRAILYLEEVLRSDMMYPSAQEQDRPPGPSR